jgi:hypothetical protein
MNKVKLGLGASAIFVGGFFLGDSIAVNRIRKKLNNLTPIMANGIGSVFSKAVEQKLDQEQIKALMSEELKFIQLVSR